VTGPATLPVTGSPRHDVVVVGGGIVGFAVLHELLAAGHTSVALVEREDTAGTHQTGRNSNVIHSGLYYRPGSHKARLIFYKNKIPSQAFEYFGSRHFVIGCYFPCFPLKKPRPSIYPAEIQWQLFLFQGFNNGINKNRLSSKLFHFLID